MKNLRITCMSVLSLVAFSLSAQEGVPQYVNEMADPSVNFYTVQENFEEYWKDKEVERSHGWKQFKRWEAFMEPRVYPTGERPNPAVLWNAQSVNTQSKTASRGLGNWSHIGPYNGNAIGGIGRVNCLEFHPDNTNIVFAGAPAGGLWRSDDGGTTWSTNTDLLPNLGVSSIAIDPHHPDTMYIATGDRDAADTYSIGLLKSTDGGQTWQTTGLSYTVNMARRIGGIYINPKNTQQIVVATRTGIQRSVDGAATFTQVQGGSWQMLTYVPTATDTLFAGSNSGGNIVRSVDAGATWTSLSTGLPTNGVTRVEIATTADDPNYVYALFSASNNGLGGIYRSTDGGTSWTMQFSGTTANLLHWSSSPGGNVSGGSTGGQGWYDLAIAVSPQDKNTVFVGGVNIWRSLNGGSSWSLSAHWFGGGGASYVHADQHYFKFKPNSGQLYVGHDGGVDRTTNGTSYTSLSDGLHITQYYKIDISEGNDELTIGGAQDNGTHLNNSSGWDRVRGGDGMDNAIAESNPNVMYAASQYGNFGKSTNGGQSFNASFNLPPNGTGQWVTPIVLDPSDDNTVYIGYDQLWKSTNAGLSFSATSGQIQGNQGIDAIAVAPNDPSVIYVTINDNVYRSGNGGSSWSNISNNITNSNSVTDIAISDVDANHIWITKSGYTSSAKVYESINGGATWNNISSGLPNLPVNTIIYQNGSNGAIYIGTDIGVYYRDAGSTTWSAFNQGLPNVIVNDLEIHYAEGFLRAGTYGRGSWESPLANNFLDKPSAEFSGSPSAFCVLSDTVLLDDESTYAPTSWEWTIVPSTFNFVNGTNAQSQSPEVVFTAKGQYTVQLIASNRFGSDTLVKVNYIGVGGRALPYTEEFPTGIPEEIEVVNPDNGITWTAHGSGNGSVFMDFYGYTGSGQKDDLVLPPLDFSGLSNVLLTYDMAYRQYSSSTYDSLQIYVSSDCGTTWTLVDARAENGSQNFATGPAQTTSFSPASTSDWRTDSLDLSAYDGMDEIRIKFVGVNDYGNNLYLDNINVDADPGSIPTADFFANDVVCENTSVSFSNLSGLNGQSYMWYFSGGSPSTSTLPNPTVQYPTAGMYDVSLVVSNSFGSDSIHKSGYMQIQQAVTPVITISSNTSTICQGEDATFWAIATNGGASEEISWTVNSQSRAVSGDTVVLSLLSHNDTVRAVLTSSLACADPREVASAPVVMTVNALPNVNAGSYSSVCATDAAFALSGTPVGGTYSGRGVSGSLFDPSSAGAGSHTIEYEYTDANGCTNMASAVIQVENAPNVFLSVKTYCENDPSENASGGFPTGGAYELNGNPVSVIDPSNLGPGKHYFTYSYSNGTCTTVKGDTITVLAAPPANPGITVAWGSLTCNVAGYQYQWLDASGNAIAGETNQVFYPQAPGNYAVRVSAGTSCVETSNYVFIENIGIDEQVAASIDLKIFPNPTTDRFTVNFSLNESMEVKVELTDMAGRVLDVQNLGTVNGDVEVPFSMQQFAKGVYMVKLTVGEVTITNRVVLE